MSHPLKSIDESSLNQPAARKAGHSNSTFEFPVSAFQATAGTLTGPMEDDLEHSFLRRLIERDPTEEGRRLRRRLVETESDARCIRRVVFLVVFLLMLSLAGLGYGAVLLPEAMFNPESHVLEGLYALGLGSLVSLLVVLGCWLWNRAVVSGLRTECLLRVLAKSQFKGRVGPDHWRFVRGISRWLGR